MFPSLTTGCLQAVSLLQLCASLRPLLMLGAPEVSMSSLDPRLDPHQHAESLLSVDVPSSFILISSLEPMLLLKHHVLSWPVFWIYLGL